MTHRKRASPSVQDFFLITINSNNPTDGISPMKWVKMNGKLNKIADDEANHKVRPKKNTRSKKQKVKSDIEGILYNKILSSNLCTVQPVNVLPSISKITQLLNPEDQLPPTTTTSALLPSFFDIDTFQLATRFMEFPSLLSNQSL